MPSVLEIHSNKTCHLNLTCDHIALNSNSNNIKIIGYGSLFSFGTKQSYNPKLLDRAPSHVSPKQTGRANRLIDYRSDFVV